MTTIHVGFLKTEYGTITLDGEKISYSGAKKGVLRKILAAYTRTNEATTDAAQKLPERLRNFWWAYVEAAQNKAEEDEFSRKFNPYHDAHSGRFASGTSYAQATLPKVGRGKPGAYTEPIHAPTMPTDRAGIEAYMSKHYPATVFNFADMPDATTAQIASEVNAHMTAHPTLKKSVIFIGSTSGVPDDVRTEFLNSRYKSIETALGEDGIGMTSQLNGKQFIVFNTKEFADEKLFAARAKELQESGWFRPLKTGVAPAAYVARHELGHALINDYVKSPQGNIYTFEQWMKKHATQAMKTSGYGYAGGPIEALAEGYAQIPYAQKPSAFAKAVHAFLQEAGI